MADVESHRAITATHIRVTSCPDADADNVRVLIGKGVMKLVARLAGPRLRAALECTAAAVDTTRQQEQTIRDLLVERLMIFLTSLGRDVQITVGPRRTARTSGRIRVALARGSNRQPGPRRELS
jgi:hypothetical protein